MSTFVKLVLAIFAPLALSATIAVARPIKDVRSFCAAHRNDAAPLEPDLRQLPLSLRRAHQSGGVTWRCDGGQALYCELGASGHACMRTEAPDADRLTAFRDFCRGQPNADYIPNALTAGLSSEWRCRGTTPQMTRGVPVDSKGYYLGNWHRFK